MQAGSWIVPGDSANDMAQGPRSDSAGAGPYAGLQRRSESQEAPRPATRPKAAEPYPVHKARTRSAQHPSPALCRTRSSPAPLPRTPLSGAVPEPDSPGAGEGLGRGPRLLTSAPQAGTEAPRPA